MAEKDPSAEGFESSPTPPYGGTSEADFGSKVGESTGGSMGAYGASSTGGDSGVSDELKAEAQNITDQAKRAKDRLVGQAQQMMGDAQEQAKTLFSEQKGMAVDTLGSVAQALRHTAQQMNERDQGTLAQYAERAAEQIDRFSQQLGEKDLTQVLHDTEDFARRQPEVFFGGAVAAGFLLARFLKASRRGRALPATTAYSSGIVATPEGFERTRLPGSTTYPGGEGL